MGMRVGADVIIWLFFKGDYSILGEMGKEDRVEGSSVVGAQTEGEELGKEDRVEGPFVPFLRERILTFSAFLFSVALMEDMSTKREREREEHMFL